MQLDARLSVLAVIVCEVAAVACWKIWKKIGWLQPVGGTVGPTDRHVIGTPAVCGSMVAGRLERERCLLQFSATDAPAWRQTFLAGTALDCLPSIGN